MAADNHNLGYEQLYQERLNETKSMITLATLLDFLDQGTGNGIDYRLVMAEARAIAEEANHDGLPSATPDVTLIASVIRSNVKIMVYNIIEFSVTSLLQAIYDCLEDEHCSYACISEKLQKLWHHTRMRAIRSPSASNETVENISKQLLDEAIANKRSTLPHDKLCQVEILMAMKFLNCLTIMEFLFIQQIAVLEPTN